MKPELDLALEWRARPLWVYEDGGGMDNPETATIVGQPLAGELDSWAKEYDGFWDPDDPRGPNFPDRDTELAFFARGRALAERLVAEVGDRWAVRFMDADNQWVQLS